MADNSIVGADPQLLPFSLEAEQSVLGAILIDPQCISDVAVKLKPIHFYLPQHQKIYEIMMEQEMEHSGSIDTVIILEELKKHKVYDDAGGKSYLLELAERVPSSKNVESYAEIVIEKYYVRSLILASRDIIHDATQGDKEASDLLDLAEQKIYDIRQNKSVEGLTSLREIIVGEVLDTLDKLKSEEYKSEYEGIKCGISPVDSVTTGFHKADLVILGARPGMGKTSMALNFARNMAMDGKTVCFFSLEMTREQVASRLISNEASIPSEKMRTGDLSDEEWKRLIQASERLVKLPIYIDETSTITVPEMKARLRRQDKVDVVIVDYLGIMHAAKDHKGNRVLEISEITRNLKTMGKELGIPVIACAQLNRGTEQKGKSHIPALSDLRDSGSIEQDADIVMFIYRNAYYDDTEDPENVNPNEAWLKVAKNRHGRQADIKLHWDGEFTRFTAIANYDEQ